MVMPDVAAIRRLAEEFEQRGRSMRTEAARVVGVAEGAPWVGHAAEAMWGGTISAATALRRLADDHTGVAALLRTHARAVEQALAEIETARTAFFAFADSLGDDVRESLGSGVGSLLGTGVQHLLRDPPGAGDPAWLDVVLPHLR